MSQTHSHFTLKKITKWQEFLLLNIIEDHCIIFLFICGNVCFVLLSMTDICNCFWYNTLINYTNCLTVLVTLFAVIIVRRQFHASRITYKSVTNSKRPTHHPHINMTHQSFLMSTTFCATLMLQRFLPTYTHRFIRYNENLPQSACSQKLLPVFGYYLAEDACPRHWLTSQQRVEIYWSWTNWYDVPPPQKNFGSQIGEFWCKLGAFCTVHLKLV